MSDRKSGKEIDQAEGCCVNCGDCVGGRKEAAVQDRMVGALGILFFLFPIIGWILYFVWKRNQPGKARKACKLAWIGFGICAAFILMCFMVVLFMPRFPHISATRVATCLHNQAMLENACLRYSTQRAVSDNTKYPDTLEDLVTEGFIDEIPLCPEGVPYIYDNITGRVICEQSSDGQSHSR